MCGIDELRVAFVGDCEGPLRLRLLQVVQFLGHSRPQLVDQGLDVHAGHHAAEHPSHPRHLVQVAHEGLARPGVLDLDGHGAAVPVHRLVHLADRRRCGGVVVELREPVTPIRAELVGEHGMDRLRGHRWCGVLQAGEGRAIGPGHLFGQCCLEHAESLAELHGTALEFPQDLEHLLGSAHLDLVGDHLGGPPADAFAESERGSAGVSQGKTCHAGRACDSALGDRCTVLGHVLILPRIADTHHRRSGYHTTPVDCSDDPQAVGGTINRMDPKVIGNPVVAWRNDTTLQIGWGAHALVVEEAAPGLPTWIAMLNGGRSVDSVPLPPRTAVRCPSEQARWVLKGLSAAGLLAPRVRRVAVALAPCGLLEDPLRQALRQAGVEVAAGADVLVFPQGQVPSLVGAPVGVRRLVPVWFTARAVHVGPVLDETRVDHVRGASTSRGSTRIRTGPGSLRRPRGSRCGRSRHN
jgi:hypothetical protein